MCRPVENWPLRYCTCACVSAEEGQFLEGEERIAFLMSKIQDLRRVYMDLKAEVACIDRRRRRHRVKEREGKLCRVRS